MFKGELPGENLCHCFYHRHWNPHGKRDSEVDACLPQDRDDLQSGDNKVFLITHKEICTWTLFIGDLQFRIQVLYLVKTMKLNSTQIPLIYLFTYIKTNATKY